MSQPSPVDGTDHMPSHFQGTEDDQGCVMNAAEDTVVTDPISRVAADRQMDNIADEDHTTMAMAPSGAPEQPQAHSTVPTPPPHKYALRGTVNSWEIPTLARISQQQHKLVVELLCGPG